ncbi:MAG: HNH endonuclease [Planctomycetes bacterium]|nr:HNH endonuclease [Planctomycetota bacterium]
MAPSESGEFWAPPTSVVVRRHTPSPGPHDAGWQTFRACLRWEFSFTCVYCRLRESDFGYWSHVHFSVDHLRPKEHFQHLAKDYDNCYYACSPCNSSKGDSYPSAEEEAAGFRFLDPCKDVVSEHFAMEEDTVVAVAGSRIAQYTLDEVRNINAEVPTKRRRRRILNRARELGELRRRLLAAAAVEPALVSGLLSRIDSWLAELKSATTSPLPCSCGLEQPKL